MCGWCWSVKHATGQCRVTPNGGAWRAMDVWLYRTWWRKGVYKESRP